MMKRILIFMLCICMMMSLSACGHPQSAAKKDTIKIGYLPITHAAPLYSAKELNGANIELVKFGSWIDLVDALNSGRIDGASILIELAMKAREKGIDVKAVALGHKDGNAIISAPEIDQVSDLKGKTIAIPHTLSSHNILLHKMLKENHLTEKDVNIVEMTPPEMPSALAAKEIASYVVAEPFGALGVTLDKGKVLYQSEELWPHSLCCALVLRSDFIEHNAEHAQQFVTHYLKAGQHIETHEDDAKTFHQTYLNIDDETLDLSLDWIVYDTLRIEKSDYQELTNSLIEMGLSDNPPAYETFVDSSFIDQAEVNE